MLAVCWEASGCYLVANSLVISRISVINGVPTGRRINVAPSSEMPTNSIVRPFREFIWLTRHRFFTSSWTRWQCSRKCLTTTSLPCCFRLIGQYLVGPLVNNRRSSYSQHFLNGHLITVDQNILDIPKIRERGLKQSHKILLLQIENRSLLECPLLFTYEPKELDQFPSLRKASAVSQGTFQDTTSYFGSMRLKVCEQILHVGCQLAHLIITEHLVVLPSRFELPDHSDVKCIMGFSSLPTDQIFLLTNTLHLPGFLLPIVGCECSSLSSIGKSLERKLVISRHQGWTQWDSEAPVFGGSSNRPHVTFFFLTVCFVTVGILVSPNHQGMDSDLSAL